MTGATGFIGHHLLASCRRTGRRVRCLVRDPATATALTASGAEVVVGSVSDPSVCERAVGDVTAIFHVAGAGVSRGAGALAVNQTGTEALVAACCARNRDAHFILLSSIKAAGPNRRGLPIAESQPPAPVDAYGRYKLLAERAVERAPLSRRSVIRAPVVFGPGDRNLRPAFWAATRGMVPAIAGPATEFSYIYVADLVSGLMGVHARTDGVGTVNVAAAEPITWTTFAAAITRACGRKPWRVRVRPRTLQRAATWAARAAAAVGHPDWLPRERVDDVFSYRWVCDTRRCAALALVDRPIPLEAALAATATWYRAHGLI